MLFIKSKIQFFESKSQHQFLPFRIAKCCLSSQRYNFLKANHNKVSPGNPNSQLFIKSKIQFFESKSQQPRGTRHKNLCCLSSQRYNFLKANHNYNLIGHSNTSVVYQVKDTIFWKQITTLYFIVTSVFLLFIKSKIQFFESKSQQFVDTIVDYECCLSSQRYNFLKANHNMRMLLIEELKVVYQVKDTIFWKQITTLQIVFNSFILLFIKSKIQFFESKSQR